MNRRAEIRAALTLTRPGQWPILATQFMVAVMLVSPGAVGGGCWYNFKSIFALGVAGVVWVVLLNGGTLAFNSAYDKDTTPVAYLPDPPPPPAWLAGVSALFMLLGVGLGWRFVGSGFGFTVAVCVGLSLLYSHPRVRLKSRPGLDLVVNMVGYGAGTTLAGVLAGTAAHLGTCPVDVWQSFGLPAGGGDLGRQLTAALSGETGWVVLAFGLLFGSFYPLTQIYQIVDDRARGDHTLATRLGPRRALGLAFGLGLLAAAALGRGLFLRGWGPADLAALAALSVWQLHIVRWWIQSDGLDPSAQEKRMYTALTLWAAVDVALLISWLL